MPRHEPFTTEEDAVHTTCIKDAFAGVRAPC
jgi:hypothetical protein